MQQRMRQIMWVRRGATADDLAGRWIGGGSDPPLSSVGEEQMRETAMAWHLVDLLVASPLRRARESARIAVLAKDQAWLSAPARGVRLEPGLRERDFGRYEGLTEKQIEAQDPGAFAEWQRDPDGFPAPGSEPVEAFRERVKQAVDRLLAQDARSALVVAHRGPIRLAVEALVGSALPVGRPRLGETVLTTWQPDGSWFLGRRSSDPEALRTPLERTGLSGAEEGEAAPEPGVTR